MKFDFSSIEYEYKKGTPVEDIGRAFDVSTDVIQEMAKRRGWSDESYAFKLDAEKEAARRLMLMKELDLSSDADEFLESPIVKKFIEDNAKYNSQVNLSHYIGIKKTRQLLDSLSTLLYDRMHSNEDDDQKNVEQCAQILLKLVAAQNTLYSMERNILKLDADDTGKNSAQPVNVNVNFV